MSFTGNWGDKIIITLKSDGKRRHKCWCKNYGEGNRCSILGNCMGSAYCTKYKNEIEEQEPVWRPKKEAPKPEEEKRKPRLKVEFYRRPGRGEALKGKLVMVRNTPHTFRIGEAVEDDFCYLSVSYGGEIHKYDKKIAFRNNGIYVYEGERCLGNGPEIIC